MTGMADGTLMTIGDLARLTGLTVKTVRFWSDEGLLPPADRTPAGLVQDTAFRASLRQAAAIQARAAAETPAEPSPEAG